MTPEDATWLKLVDVFLELFPPFLQCTSMYLSAAFTPLVYRNLGCDKNEMPFTSDEYSNLAYLYSLDGTGMEWNITVDRRKDIFIVMSAQLFSPF